MSILVSGSIAFDHLMTYHDRFKNHIMPDKIHMINLSFLIDSLHQNLGGTGGNIAYNLSLLGEKPLLFGTVGEDFAAYQAKCDRSGIDTTYVKKCAGLFTAQFYVTTDLDDNQIAAFYPGAMAQSGTNLIASADQTSDIDLAILSPDDPTGMILHAQECQELKIPFIFDIGQQVIALDGPDLLKCLKGSLALIGNDYEIELFSRKTGKSADELLSITGAVITTRGPEGSEIKTTSELCRIKPATPREIKDPTGAGDAYRAGLLSGIERKLPWQICGQLASTSAVWAIEQHGTQEHRYSLAEFRTRYQKNYGGSCPL
ncbi:hypothetical protein AUK40_06590 [Candidatus Wirthbacteria bacterium CG2_30_54_11]|uniref:Carbohydrate kinase PfkB domain-containing protein n=1 Tax=Candidatus Wirthbacteria bacterium CG2_30_54_11 TaxID=1817892 RepID=A0A1J5IP05_9BACT|nr:MAG: hypothetical protein AUK40_06590 [Candidatus Wirthbacteria bacterium CG2_30_54_11]